MSSWYGKPRRPGGVTFIAIITFLIAFLSLAAGFVFLLSSASGLANADISEGTATSYGIVEIVFGIITALVAVGLWVGNSFARLAVTALMAVRIIASIWVGLRAQWPWRVPAGRPRRRHRGDRPAAAVELPRGRVLQRDLIRSFRRSGGCASRAQQTREGPPERSLTFA